MAFYWNRDQTESVVKKIYNLYKGEYYADQLYNLIEDTVAFIMERTATEEDYEDDYARHNIINVIHNLYGECPDFHYQLDPVYINKSTIKILRSHLYPNLEGKEGIITYITPSGNWIGTWGTEEVTPYRDIVEVWNQNLYSNNF